MISKSRHDQREYRAWGDLKQRCLNPNHPRFADYGGRGITVCAEWVASFSAFYRDMGPRPAGHSIDRIDNDGPYSPGNCRWATRSQQNRNARTTRRVRGMAVADLAERHGLHLHTVKHRLDRGESMRDALRDPSGSHVGQNNGNAKLSESDVRAIKSLLARGASQTAIASTYGVGPATINAIAVGRSWAHTPAERAANA